VAALAQAQRDLLSQERYRSPYYWAAYSLSGAGAWGERPQKVSGVSVEEGEDEVSP
jgi:hypothetical protein